jgi:succinoglycan biosynthesis protein ExoV
LVTVFFPNGSGNVGDEMNAWIWPHLLPGLDEEVALLGVGTLLNADFCKRLEDCSRVMVFGTGAGYGAPPTIDSRWRFYAVRGARSCARLGLDSDRAVADAAYLLGSLNWQRLPRERGRVVVIPHHRSLRLLDWSALCEESGLTFLSPLLPAEEFFEQLISAELVLSEAMHGAILADIARIPWRAFSFGRQFSFDKWLDWSEMLRIDLTMLQIQGFYDPDFYLQSRSGIKHLSNAFKAKMATKGWGKEKWGRITPPGHPLPKARTAAIQALQALSKQQGQLSHDNVFRDKVEELYGRLDQLRRDCGLSTGSVLSGNPLALPGLSP